MSRFAVGGRRTSLGGLAAVLGFLVTPGTYSYSDSMSRSVDPLVRRTSWGAVRGVHDGARQVYAWLGIPYAKPPVGSLRWKAPRDPDAWNDTRAADRFGRSCAQIGGMQGPGLHEEAFGPSLVAAFGQPVGSEDCLTLNVWRPASEDKALPVLVFVHGGANVVGYSADPLYHGGNLAREARAVVVTMNYRLGVFGWFMHPSLRTDDDPSSGSGNLGLLDLVQALRFVQANIGEFGGDPANVTLMGQSAGAVNTYSLMVSPRADGLFHKAIALSGALFNSPMTAQDQYAERVLARLLANDGSAQDAEAAEHLAASKPAEWKAEYLRRQSTEALIRGAGAVAGGGLSTGDGTVIPADLAAAVTAGRVRRIPILVGITAEEGKFFTPDAFLESEAERFETMQAFDPDGSAPLPLSQVLKPIYATSEAYARKARTMTTTIEGLLAQTLGMIGGKVGPIYSMRFEWAQQVEPWHTVIGASHAMELPFVFANFGPSYFSPAFGRANRAGREALSAAMIASLAAFIRSGDPNHAGLGVRWEPWSRTSGSRSLVFDADLTQPRISLTR